MKPTRKRGTTDARYLIRSVFPRANERVRFEGTHRDLQPRKGLTYLNDPISGGRMLTKRLEDAIQSRRVQFGLVHEEKNEETGHRFMVQDLLTFHFAADKKKRR